MHYYSTHTAFDGRVTLPETARDRRFLRFRINTLNGPEVRNKGLALFPRKINGHYAMLSRQDGENILHHVFRHASLLVHEAADR